MNEIINHDSEPQQEPQPMPENPEPILENNEKEQAEREIREWVKKTIQEWHNKVTPDYVFVTETAAVPYGYVLKEAWKNAYPEENCPAFYRIDPRAIYRKDYWRENSYRSKEERDEGIKSYFQKRIKKDDANIIVFDEGGSNALEESFIDNSLGIAAAEISEAYKYFLDKKNSKIFVASGYPEELGRKFMFGADKESGGIAGEEDHPRLFKRPTSRLYGQKSPYREYSQDEKLARGGQHYTRAPKKSEEYTLAGAIIKDPEQRKRAIEFVKQLRKIGKEAGQELNAKLEKEK